MRQTQTLIPTLREVPAEAELASHVFLLRAGYMRKLAAGIYSFMPLGWRVVRKIEEIIREEMDRAGGLEVHMPAVQPATLWQESGRWEKYGPELLRVRDRKGSDYCIGPTHEEVIVDLVRGDVRSWRQLPLNLYQIQTKFRDEMRPRAGLLRGREFIMKDAYSFDVDEEKAKSSYDVMYETYRRIFLRCGLDFRPVEADTGNIGGSLSHEFQVMCASGEDTIVVCDGCNYAANLEMAAVGDEHGTVPDGKSFLPLEEVPTPAQRTIDEVSGFLGVKPRDVAKTILFRGGDDVVAAVVRGDHEVSPVKAKRLAGLEHELEPLDDESIKKLTGAPVGFSGPVGLPEKSPFGGRVLVVVDHGVRHLANFVTGANKVDTHLRNVNQGRDFRPDFSGDLRLARDGDRCLDCRGTYSLERAIEVGHVFFLGTKYSEPMKCNFLNESGKDQPMVMGCYGIGVTRIAAAAIEQNHDDNGIVWPASIAPYSVHVLPLQMNDPAVSQAAENITAGLDRAGIDYLLDDRKERPGVKFKDADLVGIPIRIAIGARSAKDGLVELKHRTDKDPDNVPVEEAVARVQALLAEEMKRYTP